MQIFQNFPLQNYNSFNIEAKCNTFVKLIEKNDLIRFMECYSHHDLPLLIIGGGSNILFTKDFEGIVVNVATKGIEKVDENETEVYLKVNSGEVWNDFVMYCVKNEYYGVENLTDIPGNTGSSPVQNIGAYGCEAKDIIYSLEAYNLADGSTKTFENNQCNFSYRSSIFKSKEYSKYLITSVIFKLSKKKEFNLSYSDLKLEIDKFSADKLTIETVSKTIADIRSRKLPDTKEYGNAGSFFKNPVIGSNKFEELQKAFPEIKYFKQPDGNYKLAAAWLIDSCKLKGKRIGNAGVHWNQPLVLINYGNATGEEIINLANVIKNDVKTKFGIILDSEVRII